MRAKNAALNGYVVAQAGQTPIGNRRDFNGI
jgi:hypothetical protein